MNTFNNNVFNNNNILNPIQNNFNDGVFNKNLIQNPIQNNFNNNVFNHNTINNNTIQAPQLPPPQFIPPPVSAKWEKITFFGVSLPQLDPECLLKQCFSHLGKLYDLSQEILIEKGWNIHNELRHVIEDTENIVVDVVNNVEDQSARRNFIELLILINNVLIHVLIHVLIQIY
jgi:hypothetical protein